MKQQDNLNKLEFDYKNKNDEYENLKKLKNSTLK